MKLSLELKNGEVLEGSLPRPKMRLVQAWIEIHKEDLLANWKLAVEGQQPFKTDTRSDEVKHDQGHIR